MRPFRSTSPAQAEAWSGRTVPPPEQVRAGRLIAAPMATRIAHIPFSLSYLLVGADGDLHLFDPGMDIPENEELLVRAAALVGRRVDDIATILITHLHTDHMGMSDPVRARTGARVLIHRNDDRGLRAPNPVARGSHDAWGVPGEYRARLTAGVVARRPITADAFPEDGEVLDLGGTAVRAELTPGHTSGHLSFDIPELGVHLTGDHVLPTMNPGLGLGHDSSTNPIADYLRALESTAAHDDREALPGHGHRFTGLAVRCAQLAGHVTRRRDDVAALLAESPSSSVWDIASRAQWGAGWENLDGFYMQSALFQISLYLDLIRRTPSIGSAIPTQWEPDDDPVR